MRHHRAAAAALPVALALAGCSGGGSPSAVTASPRDPCVITSSTTAVPDSCAPSIGPTQDPSHIPSSTADISPVKLAADPGTLAQGGNDANPALMTQTWTVTVPAGARLQVHAACEGVHFFQVHTTPKSGGEMRFNCGFDNHPSEVAVSESTFAKAPISYTVTASTEAPARWYVVVSGTTAPPGGPV